VSERQPVFDRPLYTVTLVLRGGEQEQQGDEGGGVEVITLQAKTLTPGVVSKPAPNSTTVDNNNNREKEEEGSSRIGYTIQAGDPHRLFAVDFATGWNDLFVLIFGIII
jgi:hypothetical protein